MGSAELEDVLVESFSASLARLGSYESLTLEIGTSWAPRDGGLLCRFSVRCLLYDAELVGGEEEKKEQHLLARMMYGIVCEYELEESDRELLPDLEPEVVGAFTQEVALPTAFPYIREAIGCMSARLGFPGVTLGTFRAGPLA
ncbi:MAG TPA: hypothetical protein VFM55_25670 [Micromonosporaceae bacterium]|nr:hypothetical protein [Micromonosporaceae bacterium]